MKSPLNTKYCRNRHVCVFHSPPPECLNKYSEKVAFEPSLEGKRREGFFQAHLAMVQRTDNIFDIIYNTNDPYDYNVAYVDGYGEMAPERQDRTDPKGI